MPPLVLEAHDSQELGSGSNIGLTLKYFIKDADDSSEALAALQEEVESSYGTLALTGLRVYPIGIGDVWWGGEATYGPASGSASDKHEIAIGDTWGSFDIGGETTHITQARSTRSKYAVSGTATDRKGAIGENGEGIEGCDILTGTYQFSITKVFNGTSIDETFRANIADFANTVNSDSFYGHAAGEVLFLGASGSERLKENGGSEWEVTYRFAVKRNSTITVNGMSITYYGWDYVWLYYEDQKDGTSNRTRKVPVEAYVEVVYETNAFSGLL